MPRNLILWTMFGSGDAYTVPSPMRYRSMINGSFGQALLGMRIMGKLVVNLSALIIHRPAAEVLVSILTHLRYA